MGSKSLLLAVFLLSFSGAVFSKHDMVVTQVTDFRVRGTLALIEAIVKLQRIVFDARPWLLP